MRKQGSCLEKEIMQWTMRAQARKATHGLGGQHQDVDRTLRGRVNQNNRGQGQMEKVCPWCGHSLIEDGLRAEQTIRHNSPNYVTNVWLLWYKVVCTVWRILRGTQLYATPTDSTAPKEVETFARNKLCLWSSTSAQNHSFQWARRCLIQELSWNDRERLAKAIYRHFVMVQRVA